jgi:hypothetical protein
MKRMDPTISTVIAATVPTLAVIIAIVRNETALAVLGTRIGNLESRLDARIETLDRDLRDWAKITMQINADVARLKDKVRLDQ